MSAIDQNKCTTRKEDQTREYVIMQDAILWVGRIVVLRTQIQGEVTSLMYH